MTLTKKLGTLLLLLTTGSLLGIITFAAFAIRTAGDGLYFVAAQIEQGMLQQLQIQTLAIRDGDEGARARHVLKVYGVVKGGLRAVPQFSAEDTACRPRH